MSKIAQNRAAALERKLLRAYASIELVTKIECYFDDSAKSIVVHVEFGDEREINEYLGDNTRAWELYRNAQTAIDADIDAQVAALLAESEEITPEQRAADAQRDSAAGYTPITDDELQQIVDDTIESSDVDFEGAGVIVGHPDDSQPDLLEEAEAAAKRDPELKKLYRIEDEHYIAYMQKISEGGGVDWELRKRWTDAQDVWMAARERYLIAYLASAEQSARVTICEAQA